MVPITTYMNTRHYTSGLAIAIITIRYMVNG